VNGDGEQGTRQTMRSCGRIRKEPGTGWTAITDGQLAHLEMAVLKLEAGEEFSVHTGQREHAAVLIHGECQVTLEGRMAVTLGPRRDPCRDLPFALFVSREETVHFRASCSSLFGVGSSPAAKKLASTVVTPAEVQAAMRGTGNWAREVRMVCWSHNTAGNLLLAGETCTPAGNWSTMPPHRHQVDEAGEEAAYEEIYYFQFSEPQGFGLTWQFDDEGGMDQAFSLRHGDALYHNRGYHPVVASPAASLYHLSFMAGPRRISQARIHPGFRRLIEEHGLENPFRP
jgi:5-deoxy-glucuronate isomerase